MIKPSGRFSFTLEPLDQFVTVGSVRSDRNRLECHDAADQLIIGFVDHALVSAA